MSEPDTSVDFLRRLRAGEKQAAAELVGRYERVIVRGVRLRMTDPQMGRLLNSVEICQSVFASFFARAAGQFDLGRPEDLVRLLVRMACNKLASQARRLRARRADRRRADGPALKTAATGGADPGLPAGLPRQAGGCRIVGEVAHGGMG